MQPSIMSWGCYNDALDTPMESSFTIQWGAANQLQQPNHQSERVISTSHQEPPFSNNNPSWTITNRIMNRINPILRLKPIMIRYRGYLLSMTNILSIVSLTTGLASQQIASTWELALDHCCPGRHRPNFMMVIIVNYWFLVVNQWSINDSGLLMVNG